MIPGDSDEAWCADRWPHPVDARSGLMPEDIARAIDVPRYMIDGEGRPPTPVGNLGYAVREFRRAVRRSAYGRAVEWCVARLARWMA